MVEKFNVHKFDENQQTYKMIMQGVEYNEVHKLLDINKPDLMYYTRFEKRMKFGSKKYETERFQSGDYQYRLICLVRAYINYSGETMSEVAKTIGCGQATLSKTLRNGVCSDELLLRIEKFISSVPRVRSEGAR